MSLVYFLSVGPLTYRISFINSKVNNIVGDRCIYRQVGGQVLLFPSRAKAA